LAAGFALRIAVSVSAIAVTPFAVDSVTVKVTAVCQSMLSDNIGQKKARTLEFTGVSGLYWTRRSESIKLPEAAWLMDFCEFI
jgi:hypothetical protein